jgi:hypothetical protein
MRESLKGEQRHLFETCMRRLAGRRVASGFARSAGGSFCQKSILAFGVVAVWSLAATERATADSPGNPAASGTTNSITTVGKDETTQPAADKSQYNLFNPTPPALMRDLSADRPDKTDCPATVDAGHFQIEMDLANMTFDPPNAVRGNVTSTGYQIAPVSLKAGLLNDADLEMVFTPYEWGKTDDHNTGIVQRTSGFDGITPRLKVNVVGNDTGIFALALVPFVNLPLSSGNVGAGPVEGGVAMPYSVAVSGWGIGFENTVHVNRNAAGTGYHTELANSVAIGHQVVGKLSLSLEFFGSVSTERNSDWVGTVDTWLTYQVNGNWSLDSGVYIGVTQAADAWHPWVGMTRRF